MTANETFIKRSSKSPSSLNCGVFYSTPLNTLLICDSPLTAPVRMEGNVFSRVYLAVCSRGGPYP